MQFKQIVVEKQIKNKLNNLDKLVKFDKLDKLNKLDQDDKEKIAIGQEKDKYQNQQQNQKIIQQFRNTPQLIKQKQQIQRKSKQSFLKFSNKKLELDILKTNISWNLKNSQDFSLKQLILSEKLDKIIQNLTSRTYYHRQDTKQKQEKTIRTISRQMQKKFKISIIQNSTKQLEQQLKYFERILTLTDSALDLNKKFQLFFKEVQKIECRLDYLQALQKKTYRQFTRTSLSESLACPALLQIWEKSGFLFDSQFEQLLKFFKITLILDKNEKIIEVRTNLKQKQNKKKLQFTEQDSQIVKFMLKWMRIQQFKSVQNINKENIQGIQQAQKSQKKQIRQQQIIELDNYSLIPQKVQNIKGAAFNQNQIRNGNLEVQTNNKVQRKAFILRVDQYREIIKNNNQKLFNYLKENTNRSSTNKLNKMINNQIQKLSQNLKNLKNSCLKSIIGTQQFKKLMQKLTNKIFIQSQNERQLDFNKSIRKKYCLSIHLILIKQILQKLRRINYLISQNCLDLDKQAIQLQKIMQKIQPLTQFVRVSADSSNAFFNYETFIFSIRKPQFKQIWTKSKLILDEQCEKLLRMFKIYLKISVQEDQINFEQVKITQNDKQLIQFALKWFKIDDFEEIKVAHINQNDFIQKEKLMIKGFTSENKEKTSCSEDRSRFNLKNALKARQNRYKTHFLNFLKILVENNQQKLESYTQQKVQPQNLKKIGILIAQTKQKILKKAEVQNKAKLIDLIKNQRLQSIIKFATTIIFANRSQRKEGDRFVLRRFKKKIVLLQLHEIYHTFKQIQEQIEKQIKQEKINKICDNLEKMIQKMLEWNQFLIKNQNVQSRFSKGDLINSLKSSYLKEIWQKSRLMFDNEFIKIIEKYGLKVQFDQTYDNQIVIRLVQKSKEQKGKKQLIKKANKVKIGEMIIEVKNKNKLKSKFNSRVARVKNLELNKKLKRKNIIKRTIRKRYSDSKQEHSQIQRNVGQKQKQELLKQGHLQLQNLNNFPQNLCKNSNNQKDNQNPQILNLLLNALKSSKKETKQIKNLKRAKQQ